MFQPRKPPLRVTVILANDGARQALIRQMSQVPALRVEADFSALGEAYSPTETAPPDVVLCSNSISRRDDFAMFEALVKASGGQIVTIADGASAASVFGALGLPAYRMTATSMRVAPEVPTKLIAIGASTGGIEALSQVLSSFPANCPPTMIVQHIKAEFLDGIVSRLDRACSAEVRSARAGHRLKTGQVVLAPGLPAHLELDARGLTCRLVEGAPVSGHRPSVDVLFRSVAALGVNAVGVILTGMGRDGAAGLGEMRRAGAWTIGQDAATSTVFGMPRVAQETDAVCEVLPLPLIGPAIIAAATKRREVAQ